jgi:hypothetical protein
MQKKPCVSASPGQAHEAVLEILFSNSPVSSYLKKINDQFMALAKWPLEKHLQQPSDHFGNAGMCDANLAGNGNFALALLVEANNLLAIKQQQWTA